MKKWRYKPRHREKIITHPNRFEAGKKRVIDTCRKIAVKEEILLLRSCSRMAPYLLRLASNRETSKQKKTTAKVARKLRTIGRVPVRELVRKMDEKQIRPYSPTLLNA